MRGAAPRGRPPRGVCGRPRTCLAAEQSKAHACGPSRETRRRPRPATRLRREYDADRHGFDARWAVGPLSDNIGWPFMPSRFCPRCGTKSASGAKFCADCGASLGGDGATTNGGWRTLAVASSVLVVFLGTGMAIWTTILEPHTLRHGPAAAPASGPAAPAYGAQVKTKTEIPAQVKTFIADLAAKAKASPKDVETWMKLGQVDARAAQLDPRYQPEAIAAFEHVLELDPKN